MAASDNPGATCSRSISGNTRDPRAIETREPVFVEDVATIRLWRRSRDLCCSRVPLALVMPLVYGKEVLGTLFLRASREARSPTTEMRVLPDRARRRRTRSRTPALPRRRQESARHRRPAKSSAACLDGTPT
jgi:hypothetical protein